MKLNNINAVHQNGISNIQMEIRERDTQNNPILQFADNTCDHETPDAKILTEIFKFQIIDKLDISKSKMPRKSMRSYLSKLIQIAQELNGVQKNNLTPKGTQEQIKMYNLRIQENVENMKYYAQCIGCDLSIVKDSKTGLYKLNINNKLFDIPERKVKIVNVETEDGVELSPQIIDE